MSEATPAGLQIWLIRHGETAWSLSGQHTGRTDIPLTAHGEAEARALAPWLRDVAFTAVLTSPLQRARRTCTLAGLAEAAAIDPGLSEWDYGEYEGRRSAEIRTLRPGWSVFRDGCPGGESPAQVADRADRLIVRLRARHGNVAAFSHGQFAGALVARWLGLPVGNGQHFLSGPASLGILADDPNHPDIPVIELWNAVPQSRPVGR